VLDLESDFDGDLKLVHLPVNDAASFIDDLKPVHVTDGFRSFGDCSLNGFGKAHGRSADKFLGAWQE
jgi:hypothetical protein